MTNFLKIVALSDTHGRHRQVKVPSGDVLVYAGDFTYDGDFRELADFNVWLGEQGFQHTLVVPGNHDELVEKELGIARGMLSNAIVLVDQVVTISGVRFFGSPWTPTFKDWAWMLDPGPKMEQVWELAKHMQPHVLITHGPARGILDRILIAPTPRHHGDPRQPVPSPHLGCRDLRRAMPAIAPKLHIFGHIHTSHGQETVGQTLHANVAVVDEDYNPRYEPVVIDLPIGG
jgi:Icc-related predicted phosphoesterase